MSTVSVRSKEEMNAFYLVAQAKQKKGPKESPWWELKAFDRTGAPCVVEPLFENVRIIGPELPHKRIVEVAGRAPFDGGVNVPTGKIPIDASAPNQHLDLAQAVFKKINDAVASFVYGLNKPGIFVSHIERVPAQAAAPAKATAAASPEGTKQAKTAKRKSMDTAIIHYSDGSKVPLTQQLIQEPDTFLKYFRFSDDGNTVYYEDFSIVRCDNVQKDGKIYFAFAFDIPMDQKRKEYIRKKDTQETAQHVDRNSWTIVIPQIKKVENGGYQKVDPFVNKYTTMPLITGPKQHASFLGNVAITLDDIFPMETYTAKFTGQAYYIGDLGQQKPDLYGAFGGMGEEGLATSSPGAKNNFGAEYT